MQHTCLPYSGYIKDFDRELLVIVIFLSKDFDGGAAIIPLYLLGENAKNVLRKCTVHWPTVE